MTYAELIYMVKKLKFYYQVLDDGLMIADEKENIIAYADFSNMYCFSTTYSGFKKMKNTRKKIALMNYLEDFAHTPIVQRGEQPRPTKELVKVG